MPRSTRTRSLFEAGAETGVVVASPATLIGLLRTVAYGWQQETVAESAREIDEPRPGALRPARRLRRGISRRSAAASTRLSARFNQAVSSLETRLLVTARKFPEHGVTNDELPGTRPDRAQAGRRERPGAHRAPAARRRRRVASVQA